MMHLLSLVLLAWFLPGAARRSLRLDDSQHDAQHENNTLAKAFEGSAEVREALIPRAFGNPTHAARSAGAWRPFGPPRHVEPALLAPRDAALAVSAREAGQVNVTDKLGGVQLTPLGPDGRISGEAVPLASLWAEGLVVFAVRRPG